MKRIPFAIIVLLIIVALAAADYFVNAPLPNLPGAVDLPLMDEVTGSYANVSQMIIDNNTSELDYVISKRDRTKQLFEKFDISSLKNVVVFKNILDKKETKAQNDRIIIYEIQGPQNQGRITYLNLKMRLIDQMDITGSINETSGFGYNSFFYNDLNNKNSGFLLTQVKDNLFGFQYNKKEDGGNFEIVKLMTETLKTIDLLT